MTQNVYYPPGTDKNIIHLHDSGVEFCQCGGVMDEYEVVRPIDEAQGRYEHITFFVRCRWCEFEEET